MIMMTHALIMPEARVQLAPGDDAYYDAKTVHFNGARYPDTNGIVDAARGAAVEARAHAVPGEYERHTRDVDATCCGVPRGAGDGPVLRRSDACASSGPCAGSSSARSARRRRTCTRSSRCALALVRTCAGAGRWREGPTCIARSSSSGVCISRASTRGSSSRACTAPKAAASPLLPTAAGARTRHTRTATPKATTTGGSATAPPHAPVAALAAESERRFCAPPGRRAPTLPPAAAIA